jgi:hypothetical protein
LQMQGDRVSPIERQENWDLHGKKRNRVIMFPSNFPKKVHAHV